MIAATTASTSCRVAGDELADRGRALGDPRALVEEARRRQRRARSRSRPGQAEPARVVERGGPGAAAPAVAEEVELPGGGTPILGGAEAARAQARGGGAGAGAGGGGPAGAPGRARARAGPRVGVVAVRCRGGRVDPRPASATPRAKIETQSSVRQAGTTPPVLSTPERRLEADDPVERRRHAARPGGVGAEREADQCRRPPRRPSPSSTRRRCSGRRRRCGRPRTACRVPTRPVANWSMLVLPSGIAPAAISRATDEGARAAGCSAKAGQAAVVGIPARSMLSLIANGMP